jgi:hypothetical protein
VPIDMICHGWSISLFVIQKARHLSPEHLAKLTPFKKGVLA